MQIYTIYDPSLQSVHKPIGENVSVQIFRLPSYLLWPWNMDSVDTENINLIFKKLFLWKFFVFLFIYLSFYAY